MIKPSFPGILALALWLAPVASSQADLDLTPRYASSNRSGNDDFKRLYFANGDEEPITIRPGPDTTVTGGNGETTLQFNDLQGASLLLRNSPLQPELPFNEETAETYRAVARRFAPQGQADVVKETQTVAFSLHNRWDASVFTTSYAVPGNEVTQSVTFINYTPGQQIVLILSAFSNEFEKAQEHLESVLRSWSTMSKERLGEMDDN